MDKIRWLKDTLPKSEWEDFVDEVLKEMFIEDYESELVTKLMDVNEDG